MRAARQQDFLRQAKQQVGVSEVLATATALGQRSSAATPSTDVGHRQLRAGDPAAAEARDLLGQDTRSARSSFQRRPRAELRHGHDEQIQKTVDEFLERRGLARRRDGERERHEPPSATAAARPAQDAQARPRRHRPRRRRRPTARPHRRVARSATWHAALPGLLPAAAAPPGVGLREDSARTTRSRTPTGKSYPAYRIVIETRPGRASTTASRARPGRTRRSSSDPSRDPRDRRPQVRPLLRRRPRCALVAWQTPQGRLLGLATRCCRPSTSRR